MSVETGGQEEEGSKVGTLAKLHLCRVDGQRDRETRRGRQMDRGEGQADMGDRETGKVGVMGTGP